MSSVWWCPECQRVVDENGDHWLVIRQFETVGCGVPPIDLLAERERLLRENAVLRLRNLHLTVGPLDEAEMEKALETRATPSEIIQHNMPSTPEVTS